MLYLPTVKLGYSLVKIKPIISLPPPEPLATRILEIAKPAIAPPTIIEVRISEINDSSKEIIKPKDWTKTDNIVLIINDFDFNNLIAAIKIGILIKKLIIPAISKFTPMWNTFTRKVLKS